MLVIPVDNGGPTQWISAAGGPAWIRWCGLMARAPLGPRLRSLLRDSTTTLAQAGVASLWALADGAGWIEPYLRDCGMRVEDEVITLEARLPPRHAPSPARSQISLEAIGDHDVAGVAALDARAFGDPWRYSTVTLGREIRASSFSRLARLDGQIAGYASGVARGRHGHINRIAVDPANQGRGLGRDLLGEMISGLRTLGVDRITLNTQRSNVISQRLYRTAGFRQTGNPLPVYHRPLS